ncbi:3-isopropylmalate dehydratase large subunit [Alteriqipengyuania flavescens]|uniref:3-isopropylmalate dehydratase large subunit n=1 Tax=Alteriqipengyuania flavescens TaxID=3053610 RepID=UPI0025B2BB6C|nr:3-isopropylmalate dehydratase large subunit [Alteriqipengyuania flavescens]WJY18212.1 3-isopropylmalate dehydratase large subunit [Alteriqipengyuania flavescens]WJY24153.1 3-isopropylmalate dehydratase large subunit [Alteriqipengyuania flavescens]
MTEAKTLLDRLWERHVVVPESEDCPAILYIDLHLVHEVTSPQAFAVLEERGLGMRRPDLTLATIDHSVPTLPARADGTLPYATQAAEKQVAQLQANCAKHGIDLLDLGDERRGIVHVVGPELGLTQPGKTIVCGDSHTSTHGAFGALAFGIGTTEVGHVLATQCLLQRKPKSMRVVFEGTLGEGVGAKDMALAMIAQVGADGGAGHAIEFCGEAVRGLSMEGRMTLCNMAIEAGARVGMVAPDDTTFAWLEGRERAPQGEAWQAAVDDWRTLQSDEDAVFDKDVTVDVAAIQPMITYGVSPDAAAAVSAAMPSPANANEQDAADYMRFAAGQDFAAAKVDRVFIGSCTNSRLSDLREAAEVMRGRTVASGVTALVVPGSEAVRRDAEAEGLHEIFLAAGAEWREPGCSMCIAMNGDRGEPGELVVSTSNRNFVGRQGKDVRTVLAGPATAAASAIAGHIADPRAYLKEARNAA